MVIEIKEKGLRVGRISFPGLARTIPYEEIEGASWKQNGRKGKLIIERCGEKSLAIGGLGPERGQELSAQIKEIVNPSLARQERALSPIEIDKVMSELAERAGIRPSVVLAFLLDQARRLRATDIHLEHIRGQYQVRFRVDGMLLDVARVPDSLRSRLISHIKNAAGLASYRRDVPQEGRLTHAGDNNGTPMELRLSVIPAHGEESLVLRMFDALRGNLGISELGFSEQVLAEYSKILEKPRGMVLLSGPGSSGKTTTIYSSLRHMMEGQRKGQRAVSLEDPIEYPLSCLSQVEVAPHKGLTFDKLLANLLRQDAEVIVVGEIRDKTTASIALRAALTGHLILSTVHCGSAAEVPRRMIDLEGDPSLVAEGLTAVMAQRLVRNICPECKTIAESAHGKSLFRGIDDNIEESYYGKGCPYCLHTGYYGRTALAELLVNSPAISALIRERSPVSEVLEQAAYQGMRTMKEDGREKAAKGITTPEEVVRVLG